MPSIHDLPPELLAHIFREACPRNLLTSSKSAIRKILADKPLLPAVVVLSMVNVRWRGLITSTPSLWTYFEIDSVCWCEATAYQKLMKGLQLFLDRSRCHPLSFKWSCLPQLSADSDAVASYHSAAFSAVMDLLVENSRRWYDVNLTLPSKRSEIPVFAKLRGNLPILRRLELVRICGPLAQQFRDIFTERPPKLECFRMDGGASSDALFFLSKTDQLAVEGITDFDYTGRVIEATATFLSLALEDSWEMGKVLDFCKLPNLKRLDISGVRTNTSWDQPWDVAILVSFVLRSGNGLTSLEIKFVPITDSDMISLLQLIPTLESLCIEEGYDEYENGGGEQNDRRNITVTTNFLERLSRSGEPLRKSGQDSNSFLPILRNLLLGVVSEGLDQCALVNAVMSRTQAPLYDEDRKCCCLQSLRVAVRVGQDDSFQVLSSLKRLGGIEVNLFYI
ncbi:hypothetical protein V5O48_005675 [Marasmius crinis-equi]|uniref:F-box domain-containing protein n=1 Tax=Marasmius crinis-equi TaxID=585013 RepID=A0ABR3FLM2_9AGAR